MADKPRAPKNHAQADEQAVELGITWDGKPDLKAKKAKIAEARARAEGGSAAAASDAGGDPEAPHGWDVIGKSDGRRILRNVTKSEADDTAARVRANSDEKVKVVPSEVRDLGAGKTTDDIVARPPAGDEGEKEPPPDE